MQIDRKKLRTLIHDYFNETELKDLCFDLKMPYEDFTGINHRDKVRELIKYCERLSLISKLFAYCKRERPENDWEEAFLEEASQPEGNIEQNFGFETLIATSYSEKQDKIDQYSGHEKHQESVPKPATDKIESLNLLVEKDIESKIDVAQHLAKEGKFAEAAGLFAQISSKFIELKYVVQARNHIRKAAGCYAQAENLQKAAECYIRAAEIWLNHTLYHPPLAHDDLKKAEELSIKLESFSLRVQVLALEAWMSLTGSYIGDAKDSWDEAEPLLLKVSGGRQIELSAEITLQKAMFARLEERWNDVETLLEGAEKREWSSNLYPVRLKLLWSLLFVYAEQGKWQNVDNVYNKVKPVLGILGDPVQTGMWAMHYAATLAQRGEGEKAYEKYLEGLDSLKQGSPSSHEKRHYYQDMIYILNHYAGYEIAKPAMNYDSQRLDLGRNTLYEDIGYQYNNEAKESYFDGDLAAAFRHNNFAFMVAWRSGDWSRQSVVYKTFAKLHLSDNEPIEATFSAVQTGDGKLIKKCAAPLVNLRKPEDVERLYNKLIHSWPSTRGYESALIALGECVNIIPPKQMGSLVVYLLETITNSIEIEPKWGVCQQSVKLFSNSQFRNCHRLKPTANAIKPVKTG